MSHPVLSPKVMQDTTLDQVISRPTKSSCYRSAPSLRPGPSLMYAAALGNARARTICDCWRFVAPVTIMSPSDLDTLSARCETVFTGRTADRREGRSTCGE
jgi:hypothetical protein